MGKCLEGITKRVEWGDGKRSCRPVKEGGQTSVHAVYLECLLFRFVSEVYHLGIMTHEARIMYLCGATCSLIC